MAMRPRGSGVRPNRAWQFPVYQDFRPVSERYQEEEAEKLLIYLPGFMKESIRVSTEDKNIVRVRGERFVGGNKWHRFQQDFPAPDDCNKSGIHAKFEGGVLNITMPRKMPKLLLDEHTKQSPHTIPQKDGNIPPRTTHSTVETPLRPTAQLPKPQNANKDQDSGVKENKVFDDQLMSAESLKTQKGDEDIEFPALRATTSGKTSGEREKPKDEKKILEGLVGSIEPKGDNVPPRTTYPTIETAPRKPTPSKPIDQSPKPQNADKDQDSGVKENKLFDDQLMCAESSKTQKGDEDIEFPDLRTTPLGKTSGEREKTKDEKKILEGQVGSIEPKIQKSKEEYLDQNRTQLIKSDKEVEKKESHDAGGKIVAEKSKDLREEFQEKVGQKESKEKESKRKCWADYLWKFISWFT